MLRRQGLRRRKDHSDIREILNAIEDELEAAIVVSSTETTCVTADHDHVRPDKFLIYRLSGKRLTECYRKV